MFKKMLLALGLVASLAMGVRADIITFSESKGTVSPGFDGLTNTFRNTANFHVEYFWLNAGGHDHDTNDGGPGGVAEANHNQSGGVGNLNQLQGIRITKIGGGNFDLVSMNLFGQASVGFLTNTSTGAGTYTLYNGSGTQANPGVVNFGSAFLNVSALVIADPFAAGGNSFDNRWDNILVVNSVPAPAGIVLAGLGMVSAAGVTWVRRRKASAV